MSGGGIKFAADRAYAFSYAAPAALTTTLTSGQVMMCSCTLCLFVPLFYKQEHMPTTEYEATCLGGLVLVKEIACIVCPVQLVVCAVYCGTMVQV